MQTLNLRLTRDNLSRPWGFRLQGGSDTGYPLSVQRVFSGSPAEGILQRNDEIKLLDNCDVSNATAKEAQDLIRTSGNQLNFIVTRDANKSTKFDNDHDQAYNEEKVSVRTARKKFLNNENRTPQPFGQFGTEYQKKSNTLPTSLTIETNNEFVYQNSLPRNQEMDDDDRADYNFMTLPVSERKKLFASPNENVMSKSIPRQRSYSFRPSQTSHQVMPKFSSTVKQRKPQEYGWGPSKEKLEHAVRALPYESTVPQRYQMNFASSPQVRRVNADKVSNSFYPVNQTTPRSNQQNRRYSSSATIPGQNRINTMSFSDNFADNAYQNHHPENRVKSQTKYIYHCGRNNESSNVEPPIIVLPASKPSQNLHVNTYSESFRNQTLSSDQSPRFFRPAYPAYTTDHQIGVDNMSIISVRSEPYSKRMDRSLGYDKPGTYRINRDSSSAQRDASYQMSKLHIGEPRTRIVANPASPSTHLNWSFWGPDHHESHDHNEYNVQHNEPDHHDHYEIRNYEQPSHFFNVQSSPKRVEPRPFRRTPTVPKSQSTLLMNPTRVSNDSVYNQVSWLKEHRDSLTGVSDF